MCVGRLGSLAQTHKQRRWVKRECVANSFATVSGFQTARRHTRRKCGGHEKKKNQRETALRAIGIKKRERKKNASSNDINGAADVMQDNEGSDCPHCEILSRCGAACWKVAAEVFAQCDITSGCWRRRSRRQKNNNKKNKLVSSVQALHDNVFGQWEGA